MPDIEAKKVEHQRLKKWGGSFGFTIPEAFMDMFGLKKDVKYTIWIMEEKTGEKPNGT